MYALLRSLLIFICELNYQFVSCLFICQLHCQVMSGEVAKANPNFCVGRWAACFLVTLFTGWWGSRGGGRPGRRLLHLHSWLLAPQSLWNGSAPWSLPFTLAFFCFDAAKEGQYGKWKVTARKFSFSPSSSFLVQACSLPHTETVPASVPQGTLNNLVFIALRAIRLPINLVAS